MIQIYTGSGKGKTTAALGLALRALGQGKKVYLIQFLKKGKNFGELRAAAKFSGFKTAQFGSKRWVKPGVAAIKDRKLVAEGWRLAQEVITSKKYDLVILDELNVAINYSLIALKEVKQALKDWPKPVEIVITGRGAHPAMIKVADLVSEVKELKHYYHQGISARAGIEY